MNMKKKISKANMTKLRRHSSHHTKKHMSVMRRHMRAGKSFAQSHRMAIRRVGK